MSSRAAAVRLDIIGREVRAAIVARELPATCDRGHYRAARSTLPRPCDTCDRAAMCPLREGAA